MQKLEHSMLLQEGELSFRMRMRSTGGLSSYPTASDVGTGIVERVLHAGGQENLNSCGHLPSAMKILFTEKS